MAVDGGPLPVAAAPAAELAMVVVAVTEPMEAPFAELHDAMRGAMTNFERVELVQAFGQRYGSLTGARRPTLTCAQLGTLAEVVTLSTRRKEVLTGLHPHVRDKGAPFHALVEAQLVLGVDREDVLREVARTERRAWIEECYGD